MSIKAIKRETGKHRGVIRKVLELAEQEGWLDDKGELPSEHQLQEVYHEQRDGEDSIVRGPVGEPCLSRARAALRVPDFALSAAPSRTQGWRGGRYQVRQEKLPASVPRSPEGARPRDPRRRRTG